MLINCTLNCLFEECYVRQPSYYLSEGMRAGGDGHFSYYYHYPKYTLLAYYGVPNALTGLQTFLLQCSCPTTALPGRDHLLPPTESAYHFRIFVTHAPPLRVFQRCAARCPPDGPPAPSECVGHSAPGLTRSPAQSPPSQGHASQSARQTDLGASAPCACPPPPPPLTSTAAAAARFLQSLPMYSPPSSGCPFLGACIRQVTDGSKNI